MEPEKAKTYFWILLDVLILGIIVNLVFFVMPAVNNYGKSLVASRTLTVSASGKTFVSPDVAESSFSVVSRGKNPDELSDTNNQKITAVINFLKSSGLDEKDIKTTAYNLSPDYQYDPQTQRNFITGYTLTQTVSVKIRDLLKVANIIGGLTPLGVNQIGGINFSVDNPETSLSVARADALQKVKKKAENVASQSGVRLGRVLNFSESSGIPPIPYYGASADMFMKESATPTIEPGTQEVTVQVTVTYELE